MRISQILGAYGVLAATVSSSTTGKLNDHGEGRSSYAFTPLTSQLEARTEPHLRILVAGASIAFGFKSPAGNGFRYGLEQALVAAGNDVQMLGTVRAGSMDDNACEAIPGLRIDQVMARVDSALRKISPPPNIILIEAGANDLGQKVKVDAMQRKISTLLDHICATIPNANVVLSTLLPSRKAEAGVLAYNAKLVAVVEGQKKMGRHVYLADVHSSDFSTADILPLPDGTHPTPAGYDKMAGVYADVILRIVKERFASHHADPYTVSVYATTKTIAATPPSLPDHTPVASSTSASAKVTPTGNHISKALPSSLSAINLAAGTPGPAPTPTSSTPSSSTPTPSASTPTPTAPTPTPIASTPSASAPPRHGSGSHFGQPGPLVTVAALLSWTVFLFAL